MDNKLAEKIERLEAQLPRWEKWLNACYGAAITMFASSIGRAFEMIYLYAAFSQLLKKIKPTDSSSGIISFTNDPITLNVQQAIIAPYWQIIDYLLLIACAIPVILLILNPAWRKVPFGKRLNLIFGYLLVGWFAFVSLAILGTFAVSDGSNILIIGYPLALGLGYWWLRRKKDRAEEVFP